MSKRLLKKLIFKLMGFSLTSACNEQNLTKIKRELVEILPNIEDQYTNFKVREKFWIDKVRSLHAFQMSLVMDAIKLYGDKSATIVDIGDSSGTHLKYLKSFFGEGDYLGVNLDPEAIKKIRNNGFEAIESRAENMHEHPEFKGKVDVFLSFEMLEHLLDPISFLHDMSTKSVCDYFVITVPYLYRSRVGLYQVRRPDVDIPFNAESTHILELCPDDWDLIFRFSGWKIVKSVRYTQYPKKNLFGVTRYLWRRFDFDGFYGVILQKDDSISKNYTNWG